MRKILILLSLTIAVPAIAAPQTGEPDKPAKAKAVDAITQPLSDANIKKKKIADVLLTAVENPYKLDGIKTCSDVAAGVNNLDTALGPDFDMPVVETRDKKRQDKAINVAGGVVNGFIPFRSVARELSGASKADNEYRRAIYAGVTRRAFLKGYGMHMACKPPAAPIPLATPAK